MVFGFLTSMFGKKKVDMDIPEAVIAGTNEIPHVDFDTKKNKSNKFDNDLLDSVKNEIKSTTENLTKLTSTVKDMDSSVSKMVSSVETLEKKSEENDKKFRIIDENMRKFLSLYEIVNNQYNPFVVNDGKNPKPVFLETTNIEPIEKVESTNEEDFTMEVEEIPKENIENIPKNLPGFGPNFEYDEQKAKEDLEKIQTKETKKMEEIKPISQNKKEEIKKEFKELVNDDDLSFFDFDTLNMAEAANDAVPLTAIPNNTNSLFVILSWMEYLVKRMGIDATRDVLRYYTETLKWITPEVFFELDKYLRGMNEMTNDDDFKQVNVRDHIVSLYFISKLNGKELEKKLTQGVLRIIKNQ